MHILHRQGRSADCKKLNKSFYLIISVQYTCTQYEEEYIKISKISLLNLGGSDLVSFCALVFGAKKNNAHPFPKARFRVKQLR